MEQQISVTRNEEADSVVVAEMTQTIGAVPVETLVKKSFVWTGEGDFFADEWRDVPFGD